MPVIVIPGGGGGGGPTEGDNTDPIITVADIEAFTQTTVPSGKTAAVEDLIERATSEIELVAGRHFRLSTVTETIDGTYDQYIYLRYWPVTSVTTVDVSGTELTGTQFGVKANGVLYRTDRGDWRGTGTIRWCDPVPQAITVTYQGGYAAGAIPGPIRDVAIRMVARAYQSPNLAGAGTVQSETLGDYSVTYAVSATEASKLGGLIMSDEEERIVKRYRRQFTTIPLHAA